MQQVWNAATASTFGGTSEQKARDKGNASSTSASSVIGDVQKKFAGRPLFDGDVSRQLDMLERRQSEARESMPSSRHYQSTLLGQDRDYGMERELFGESRGGPSEFPEAAGYDNHRSVSAGVSAAHHTQQGRQLKQAAPQADLPAPIHRPASVQQYLAGMNQAAAASTAAPGGPYQQPPKLVRPAALRSGGAGMPEDEGFPPPVYSGATRRTAADHGLVTTPRQGRRTPRRTTPRSHSHRNQVVEDERQAVELVARMASRTGPSLMPAGADYPEETDEEGEYSGMAGSPHQSRMNHVLALRQAEVTRRLNDEDIKALVTRDWETTTDPRRVDAHIARAALRTQLQREQLQAQGKADIVIGVVDGAAQTEGPSGEMTTHPIGQSLPTTGEGAAARVPTAQANTSSTAAAAASTTAPPPAGYLLSPSVPYQQAEKPPTPTVYDPPPVPLTASDVAGNGAKAAGGWPIRPAPKVADGSSSTAGTFPSTGAMVSAATTAPDESQLLQPDESVNGSTTSGLLQARSGTEAIRRVTQRAASPLIDRIDQLQLENEELLVKNKALPQGALPGDAGYRTRNTIIHVAEANRKIPPSSTDIPVPLGGYDSMMEQPPAETDFSPSRWQEAKLRSDIDHLRGEGNLGSKDLRRWASELPTQTQSTNALTSEGPPAASADSSGFGKSVLRTGVSGISTGSQPPASAGYSARKKWGNVSFATPLERVDGHPAVRDPLEELSASAKLLMQPPTLA